MHTEFDCIPCFARQVLDVARIVSSDPADQERVLRAGLELLSRGNLRQPPPLIAAELHRVVREMTGNPDPFRAIKERFNAFALELYPELTERIAAADDPFATAVRLAIAGNIIDFGVHTGVDEDHVLETIDMALADPALRPERLAAFRRAVDNAGDILYIGDNTGEIVFDRVFIEHLGPARCTFVVRSGPIINDVTRADAEAVGLSNIVDVVDSGYAAPGTPLVSCSPAFRERFANADLIIAKGQGNYETLNEEPGNIWFLLKVKCDAVAGLSGQPVGEIALVPGKSVDGVC